MKLLICIPTYNRLVLLQDVDIEIDPMVEAELLGEISPVIEAICSSGLPPLSKSQYKN